MTAGPVGIGPGLNASHVDFLRRLVVAADHAGVTITYCYWSLDWGVMTSPELDDEAGTAFLAALDVGDAEKPRQLEDVGRWILAGPRFHGGVRLWVKPIPGRD